MDDVIDKSPAPSAAADSLHSLCNSRDTTYQLTPFSEALVVTPSVQAKLHGEAEANVIFISHTDYEVRPLSMTDVSLFFV